MTLYELPVFFESFHGLARVTEHRLEEKKTGIFLEEASVSEFPDVGTQESSIIQPFEQTAKHDHPE